MKVKRIVICTVVAALFAIGAAAETSAVVKSFTGKVEIRNTGAAWTAVSEGMEIPAGATISTGFRSQAVLEIGTAVLEVKPLTRMRLDELIEKEGTVKTDLYLRVGRVSATVRKTSGLQNDFRLRSPVSTAAVRGTSFSFDGSNLEVVEGLVALINTYGQRSGVPAGVRVATNGVDIPQGALDAMNAMYGVSISAAQIDEIIDAYDLSGVIQSGGVIIGWSSGGMWN